MAATCGGTKQIDLVDARCPAEKMTAKLSLHPVHQWLDGKPKGILHTTPVIFLYVIDNP